MSILVRYLSVYARMAWAILRRRPYELSLLVSKGCNRLWVAFPVKPSTEP